MPSSAVRRAIRYTLVAVLAFSLGGTALVAASGELFPDVNGVIYGCVHNPTGAVRIVQSTTTCTADETPVSWSQTGPAGAAGPAGPQGLPGIPGPIGPSGGPVGPTGPA